MKAAGLCKWAYVLCHCIHTHQHWFSPGLCALPLLLMLYANNCGSSWENSYLVKFSDDTALLSLLQGNQSDHESALMEFVRWCDDSFLDLNVFKTKEFIIDFRKHCDKPKGSVIHNEDVQIFQTYK